MESNVHPVNQSLPTPLLDKSRKPRDRGILCRSCQWFRESPISRWRFGLFLLFAASSIIWSILRSIISPISGLIFFSIFCTITSILTCNTLALYRRYLCRNSWFNPRFLRSQSFPNLIRFES